MVIILLIGITNLHSLSGQSIPQGISYQAVAINTETKHVAGMNIENTYWSNKKIKVRFTLLDKYPGGIPQLEIGRAHV